LAGGFPASGFGTLGLLATRLGLRCGLAQ